MVLTDKDIPVLCLLDVIRKNYVEVSGVVEHTTDGECTDFDCRNLSSKRWYLKCVLSWRQLGKKGVARFKSGLNAAFYELFLVSRKPVLESLTAAECKRQLKLLRTPNVLAPVGVLPPPLRLEKPATNSGMFAGLSSSESEAEASDHGSACSASSLAPGAGEPAVISTSSGSTHVGASTSAVISTSVDTNAIPSGTIATPCACFRR